MSEYDYDLKVPEISAFKDSFIEAMTQEKPNIDKMSSAFEAVVAAFDDLSQQSNALDMIRAKAKERIFTLNDMLNKRMNSIIKDKTDIPEDDKKEAEEKAKASVLGSFFDQD